MADKGICKKMNVAIVTGSRAEYGLLYWLINRIHRDEGVNLQLIVTGTHLSPEFGMTIKEIIKDGFPVAERVEMLLSSDSEAATSISTGLALMGFAKAYERLMPHIVVVLGDRFEIFAAAAAAIPFRIPVAHIHGGEVTEGSMDELFRHAITKMSYLHFTSTEEYRKRVIQMGEDPKRVFYVGAVGLDNINRLKLLSREEIEDRLGFRFARRNLLVTYHPATLRLEDVEAELSNLLEALSSLEDTLLIFTKSNADPKGRLINRLIDAYVERNRDRAVVFTSMNQLKYLSVMKEVDAVVGNSSSGIIEAPSFNVATVNIGARQRGRIKADSIVDCASHKDDIVRALRRVLSEQFRQKLKDVVNPYWAGYSASDRIADIIKDYPVEDYKGKTFYNIKFSID